MLARTAEQVIYIICMNHLNSILPCNFCFDKFSTLSATWSRYSENHKATCN